VIALFRRRPWLAGKIAHLSLGRFPTPIDRVPGLLPRGVDLWVKREDRAATIYGGNKVRKLELLLADAEARGKKRVATLGGWGSHHALATALFARERGLGCDLHLFPQPMNEHVREQLRADLAAGARVHVAASLLGVLPSVFGVRMRSEVAWLAPGGSSPLGSLGWVSAADEIIEQVARGELPAPDVVYVALGSCGTVAGLLAGFRGAGFVPEVVGVRVVERPISGFGPTRALEERTLALLDEDATSPVPFRVAHAQIGRCYGAATPAAKHAVIAAAGVGLRLESTYTGKAMAQLLADAASGKLDGKRVLFIDSYSSVDLAPLLATLDEAAIPASIRAILARRDD
jgi:D-cysteine desulfhydrase